MRVVGAMGGMRGCAAFCCGACVAGKCGSSELAVRASSRRKQRPAGAFDDDDDDLGVWERQGRTTTTGLDSRLEEAQNQEICCGCGGEKELESLLAGGPGERSKAHGGTGHADRTHEAPARRATSRQPNSKPGFWRMTHPWPVSLPWIHSTEGRAVPQPTPVLGTVGGFRLQSFGQTTTCNTLRRPNPVGLISVFPKQANQ